MKPVPAPKGHKSGVLIHNRDRRDRGRVLSGNAVFRPEQGGIAAIRAIWTQPDVALCVEILREYHQRAAGTKDSGPGGDNARLPRQRAVGG